MPTAANPSAASAAARRCDALDGLRGIAALGVLALHVWMFHYGDAGRPPKGMLDYVLGELRLGVQLFFVLSGYLVFRPFVAAALDGGRPPALGRYALRRAARILPGYWAAALAGFFVLRHFHHPLQVRPGQLPVFLLFAQNHFDTTIKHLDPPMWTLAVEVSFYVLVPVAGALALRLGPRPARQLVLCLALVAAGAACTALSAEHDWPVTLSTSLLLHLGEFGAGMCVATLLHRRAVGARAALALLLAGAALIAANSAWHALGLGGQEPRSVVGDLPGVAGIALVVAALAGAPGRLAAALASRPLRLLGAVSYGVYLAHFLVIVALRQTELWPRTLAGEMAAVIAVTLPLASASWLLVERPAIRWAQRRTAATRRAGDRAAARGGALLRPRPAES